MQCFGVTKGMVYLIVGSGVAVARPLCAALVLNLNSQYRMPEKLQIVKPMEGSATLHHWLRLATPHMAGIFEERDGVQIKHEQPLTDMDSTTYSLLDVEEEGLCLIMVENKSFLVLY